MFSNVVQKLHQGQATTAMLPCCKNGSPQTNPRWLTRALCRCPQRRRGKPRTPLRGTPLASSLLRCPPCEVSLASEVLLPRSLLRGPPCEVPLARSVLRGPSCEVPLARSPMARSFLRGPPCEVHLARSLMRCPSCEVSLLKQVFIPFFFFSKG